MKPMLAVAAEEIPLPGYVSYKLDGIRCPIVDGIALSRTLKPIPNEHISEVLSEHALNGLDGELIVGAPNLPNVFQTTSSGVMSRQGRPNFTFWVFDYWTSPDTPYDIRYDHLQSYFKMREEQSETYGTVVKLLPQKFVTTEEEVLEFEAEALSLGYEGVMFRKKKGLYKYGRSTAKEGHLLKIKRFVDGEAVVIGFEELLRNENELTINALGYAERSSRKDGKVPGGVLGSFVVRDLVTGVEFTVGTGYTAAQRLQYWAQREQYLGVIVKYKSFPIGVKIAPRIPVFLGFRHKDDL